LTEIVVLPTPPLPLATPIICVPNLLIVYFNSLNTTFKHNF
jgi:hypothetical protein